MKSHEVRTLMDTVQKEFSLKKNEVLLVKNQIEDFKERERRLEDDLHRLRGHFDSYATIYDKILVEEARVQALMQEPPEEEKVEVIVTEEKVAAKE